MGVRHRQLVLLLLLAGSVDALAGLDAPNVADAQSSAMSTLKEVARRDVAFDSTLECVTVAGQNGLETVVQHKAGTKIYGAATWSESDALQTSKKLAVKARTYTSARDSQSVSKLAKLKKRRGGLRKIIAEIRKCRTEAENLPPPVAPPVDPTVAPTVAPPTVVAPPPQPDTGVTPGPGGGGDNSGDPQRALGRQLYAANCAACHGAIASSNKKGATFGRIQGAIGPSSPVLAMRSIQLTTQEVEALVAALAVGGTTPPVPGPLTVANTSTVLGTRPLIASVLNRVFVNETDLSSSMTQVRNIIRDQVLNNISFGGYCQPSYEADCPRGSDVQTMSPASSTTRSGWKLRSCDSIVSIAAATDYALSQVGLQSTMVTSEQNIALVWDLFMPGRAISPAALTKLATLTDSISAIPRDEWPHILSALCNATVLELL